MGVLAVAIAVTVVAGSVWVGRRRRALGRTALAALALVGLIWGLGVGLMFTGWKDIDGWIDCHDACDAWQEVGALLFWTPLLAGSMLLIVVVVAAVLAARSRGDASGSEKLGGFGG